MARKSREETLASRARIVREAARLRSEEHTSELQSPDHLVCRLLLEKKKQRRCPLAAPRLADLNRLAQTTRQRKTPPARRHSPHRESEPNARLCALGLH